MKRLLAVLALALPVAGLAQDAAPALQEDPRAAHYRDVERGFYVGFEIGYLHLLQTPVADPEKFRVAGTSGGSAGGIHVAVDVGYDFGSRFSLGLFGQGGNEKAGPNYGAFSLYAGGVDARVALFGTRDRNDWERFFVYVHARGGYAKTYPTGLFGSNDLVIQGGPGVEYYTQLRHFSVGFAADFVRALKAKANGFAVYPTVRYTF